MSGFDDSGVNRAHRNLVKALTLDGQERVARALAGRTASGSKRLWSGPLPVIKPGSRVDRWIGFESVEISNRPLQPDCGRVNDADGRVALVQAIEAEDGDLAMRLVKQSHVDLLRLSPKAHQRPEALRQL
jgi:hypothetical protein